MVYLELPCKYYSFELVITSFKANGTVAIVHCFVNILHMSE